MDTLAADGSRCGATRESTRTSQARTGASVIVSMPSRREVTPIDPTIDDRSTRLLRAFAPRPT
jgi:hypothetical protein